MRKRRRRNKGVLVAAWCNEDVKAALAARAEAQGTTLSQQLRTAIFALLLEPPL